MGRRGSAWAPARGQLRASARGGRGGPRTGSTLSPCTLLFYPISFLARKVGGRKIRLLAKTETPVFRLECDPYNLNKISDLWEQLVSAASAAERAGHPRPRGQPDQDETTTDIALPGFPCCLCESQLSERESFRCVQRTNLQRSGVRSGKQDLSAVFFLSHPTHPAEEEAFSSRTPPIAGPGLSEDPPRRLSSISQTKTIEE